MTDLARESLLLQEAGVLAAGAWPRGAIVDRVVVRAEVGSTQDEAKALCEGRGGLMVLALAQHAGRGRLGRTWRHAPGKGVAATFVLDAAQCDASEVPLRAGLAALLAARRLTQVPLGVRWPNDVVLREDTRKKLAGVLVESQGGLYFVGIGLNVTHEQADWELTLRERATSLRLLGSNATMFEAARELISTWTQIFAMSRSDALSLWREADALAGTTQTFEHDGRRVRGIVIGIEPTSEIVVRSENGELVRLPALSTSMVHEGG
jgi:BirA family biotin operon repressor/biotin-[acetyl-CoA-carboxylase] ligase